MQFIVRKIDLGKWLQTDIKNGRPPSADACTGCLRTQRNALSLWAVQNEADADEGVLAQATVFDHLDTIDIVLLKKSEVEAAKLNLVATPGRTLIADLKDRHRDITDLDYESLGVVASLIVAKIRDGAVKRYTKGDLTRLLKAALAMKRVTLADLSPNLSKKLA